MSKTHDSFVRSDGGVYVRSPFGVKVRGVERIITDPPPPELGYLCWFINNTASAVGIRFVTFSPVSGGTIRLVTWPVPSWPRTLLLQDAPLGYIAVIQSNCHIHAQRGSVITRTVHRKVAQSAFGGQKVGLLAEQWYYWDQAMATRQDMGISIGLFGNELLTVLGVRAGPAGGLYWSHNGIQYKTRNYVPFLKYTMSDLINETIPAWNANVLADFLHPNALASTAPTDFGISGVGGAVLSPHEMLSYDDPGVYRIGGGGTSTFTAQRLLFAGGGDPVTPLPRPPVYSENITQAGGSDHSWFTTDFVFRHEPSQYPLHVYDLFRKTVVTAYNNTLSQDEDDRVIDLIAAVSGI